MNMIVKNAIVIFTLLCAMFLIVFCVELVIVNKENADARAEQSASGSADQSVRNDSGEQQASNAKTSKKAQSNDEATGNSNTAAPEQKRSQKFGARYELPMFDEVHTLIVFVDDELFNYDEGETNWTFTCTGDEKSSLEIVLTTLDGSAEEYAEEFLEGYLDGGTATVGGERQIGKSALNGLYVSGEKDDEVYEAWVYGPLEGGIANRVVLFVLNYWEGEQEDALYNVIDTLEMASTWNI